MLSELRINELRHVSGAEIVSVSNDETTSALDFFVYDTEGHDILFTGPYGEEVMDPSYYRIAGPEEQGYDYFDVGATGPYFEDGEFHYGYYSLGYDYSGS
jgi:hypothetical protein